MAETENIIIKDTLDGLGTDAYSNYLTHALCLAGSCRLKYNGEERELQAGDLMIVRKGKLVERIRPADDFRVTVIYVTSEFIVLYTVLDISRLLRDKSLTFVRISDLFGFSSPAYFSRYVQQHLGVSPTEYRG